jgi:hypothetical protein
MKEMFKVLYDYAKEDPKDFICSVIFLVSLFGLLWATLWLHAICVGNV